LYSYALFLIRKHAEAEDLVQEDYAEAEDLVQETYVRAIPAMGRLRADSNMKGWLFTILRNVWLNHLRKWRSGPQMVEIEDGVANSILEPSKDSHDLYVSKMVAEQVRAAINDLPVEFRETVLLREYDGLSYQEIANVLECPVGTVMSRLGRARVKLRPLLSARLKGFDRPERGAQRVGWRLHRWQREVRGGGGQAFPGAGRRNHQQEIEMIELERKVGRQAIETDFLRRCLQHVEEQRKQAL
jgi:RNA polymerase sigma-70 factor (ECF subfamily)